VTFDWERTTADEYNEQNSPLKAVSQDFCNIPPDAIKRALKRLSMYPKPKYLRVGENNDEETLRTDSEDYKEEKQPGRVDDIQGQPDIGLVHNF